MTEEIKSSLLSQHTPVANKLANNKWLPKLFLLLGSVIIIIAVCIQHLHKINQIAPPEEIAPAALDMQAPQLSVIQQQKNEIEADIAAQQNSQLDVKQDADKLEKMRMVAPTTAYSLTGSESNQSSNKTSVKNGNGVLGGSGDVNTQFMNQVSNSDPITVTATKIAHPATTLAQGTMIWATLESHIISDLPGMIRAITSEDIYSEDGTMVLLPKGSRLIGQYTNAILQGQQRVFVVWQRVLRPDHIAIELNSPGTDSLGGAGVGADYIDHHFIEQFGTAALLSIISAGAANVGVGPQDQLNSASAYREALSNSFAQTAQNNLQTKGNINPTDYIDQGKPVSVFVSRDLDFNAELMR